jgi:hypothetical protein
LRNIFLGSLLALLMAFSGCVNISEVDISKIEIQLTDSAGKAVNSLVPGWEYQVKVVVCNDEGKIIRHPDYRQIEFNSPNLILSKTGISKICVSASRDTWGLLHQGQYEATFSVKDNRYPAQERKWPVNWNWGRLNTLSYQGRSGKNGFKGRNGKDGIDGKHRNAGGNGSDGSDGGDGGCGGYGTDTNLVVVYYDVSGIATNTTLEKKMLLFYNLEDGSFFLSKIQPFDIITSGGNGGDGGDGGNGGNGGDGDPKGVDIYCREGKNGGDGGNGGTGGNGGDAGNITVWYYDQSVLDYIHTAMNGGRAGRGGKAGKGGLGGVGCSGRRDGSDGIDGNYFSYHGLDGRAGSYSTVAKSFAEIAAMLKKAGKKEFDDKRLMR